MTRRIFVGLSGPTFFDYQHTAQRTSNDRASCPNPVLENALGLIIFYDEVWFLCESLCPQTLRGHDKVKYLDKVLGSPERQAEALSLVSALSQSDGLNEVAVHDVISGNFADYWQLVAQAGAFWWNDPGRAMDNHTNQLDVLGFSTGANSNAARTLAIDLATCNTLRSSLDMSVSLNSFTQRIYDRVFPNQYDPLVDASNQVICSSAVINALVPNCMTVHGPHADIFDKVANSAFTAQFRGYIAQNAIGDARDCYLELSKEIESSIEREVKRAADRLHPSRGVSSIVLDAVHDIAGTGLLKSIGSWIIGISSPRPISAAAFVLDLRQPNGIIGS